MSVTSLQFDDFAKVLNRMEQQNCCQHFFRIYFTPEICRKSALANTIISSQERVLLDYWGWELWGIDQHTFPFVHKHLKEKNILIVSAYNGKN